MARPFTGKTGLNLLPLSHSATGHSAAQHPYDDADAMDPPREVIASCYNPPKGASGGPPGGWRVPTNYYRWAWTTEDAELTGDVYKSSFGSPYTYIGKQVTHTGNRAFSPYSYVSAHGLKSATAGFLHSEVRIKARNRLKGETVNLAEIFGDAPRTAKQVASLVKSGYNLTETYLDQLQQLKDLIRRKPGSKQALIKQASDFWLGYIYGIRPLINDAYSVSNLLRQQIASSQPKGQLLVAVARVERSYDTRDSGWRSGDGNIVHQYSDRCETYKAEAKYYAKVPDNWYFQADRFGVINPYLIIWNATGLSFVIDWFYSVASWLESLSATIGLSIAGGYSCVRLDVDETSYWDMPDSEWYRHKLINGTSATVKSSFSAIERLADNNGSGIVLPYVKSPFSTQNVITAAALIAQRRRVTKLGDTI